MIEGSEFSEAEIYDKNSGVILISQSGQTADVYRAVSKTFLSNFMNNSITACSLK